MSREQLTALKFVGPSTAAALEDAGIDADDVADRAISHAQLIEAGVNPGVAAKIRREHSLAWSFEGGQDLDRRAEQVRGLGDEERAWVAASAGDWEDADVEDASTDGSGSASATEAAWRDRSWPGEDGESAGPDGGSAGAGDESEDVDGGDERGESTDGGAGSAAELAWRQDSAPTPVEDLDPVSAADAETLARAGVTSVRSLATASVERLADSLELDRDRVRRWRDAAREHEDGDASTA